MALWSCRKERLKYVSNIKSTFDLPHFLTYNTKLASVQSYKQVESFIVWYSLEQAACASIWSTFQYSSATGSFPRVKFLILHINFVFLATLKFLFSWKLTSSASVVYQSHGLSVSHPTDAEQLDILLIENNFNVSFFFKFNLICIYFCKLISCTEKKQ